MSEHPPAARVAATPPHSGEERLPRIGRGYLAACAVVSSFYLLAMSFYILVSALMGAQGALELLVFTIPGVVVATFLVAITFALPAMIAIALGEHYRIRAAAPHALVGALVGLSGGVMLALFLEWRGNHGTVNLSLPVDRLYGFFLFGLFLAINGAVGGLIYWRIAVRERAART